MDSIRYGPHPRKDLNTWRYYQEHFNVQGLEVLPVQGFPPSTYYHRDVKPSPVTKKFNSSLSPTSKKKESKANAFFKNVLEGLDHYCDTSTLHGLKYVGENRYSKAERLFWLVSFIVAVCFAFYFITLLFLDYNNSPVIVGFDPEMTNVQSIPFPAITICNTNVALKSRAENLKRTGSKTEQMILDDLCNFNTSDATRPTDITYEMVENVIRNVTQICREMMIGCQWQGKKYICADLINSVLTDDGYCCSFNKLPPTFSQKFNVSHTYLSYPDEIVNWTPESGYPDNAHPDIYPYRAYGRGIQQGLTLVLDNALHEYYCSTTNSFGFKAIFHTPRESPKIAELGFLILPGMETRIAVNVEIERASESIRGIDYRKRKCFFSNEKFLKFFKLYSARNCLLECEANYTQTKCGCTPFFLPREPATKVCDKSEEGCTNQAKFEIERYGDDRAACECLPGCSQYIYNPAIHSEGKLMNLNNITYHQYLGNFSQEYFAENVAIVHIFYNVDRFQVQVKTAMYSFSQFLSNTGGLLGLFMGFSFLSVVEIVFFLFIRGPCIWCQRRINKNTQKH